MAYKNHSSSKHILDLPNEILGLICEQVILELTENEGDIVDSNSCLEHHLASAALENSLDTLKRVNMRFRESNLEALKSHHPAPTLFVSCSEGPENSLRFPFVAYRHKGQYSGNIASDGRREVSLLSNAEIQLPSSTEFQLIVEYRHEVPREFPYILAEWMTAEVPELAQFQSMKIILICRSGWIKHDDALQNWWIENLGPWTAQMPQQVLNEMSFWFSHRAQTNHSNLPGSRWEHVHLEIRDPEYIWSNKWRRGNFRKCHWRSCGIKEDHDCTWLEDRPETQPVRSGLDSVAQDEKMMDAGVEGFDNVILPSILMRA